jgi:hypothetical protein
VHVPHDQICNRKVPRLKSTTGLAQIQSFVGVQGLALAGIYTTTVDDRVDERGVHLGAIYGRVQLFQGLLRLVKFGRQENDHLRARQECSMDNIHLVVVRILAIWQRIDKAFDIVKGLEGALEGLDKWLFRVGPSMRKEAVLAHWRYRVSLFLFRTNARV